MLAQNRQRINLPHLATLMWGAFALAFLFLVIKNSALAASLTYSALQLCGKTLIPALFPSAVAARVIAESGALAPLATPFNKISAKLFGLSGESLAVALTGIICGFPTGAVGAVSLYKKGRLDEKQLLRASVLSGTPSLSFLVFAVGERCFGDRNFGFFLFFLALFSSVLVTAVLARIDANGEKTHKRQAKNGFIDPKSHKNTEKMQFFEKNAFGVTRLTSAVSASALDIVRVSSFVIFFSVAAGLFRQLLSASELTSPLIPLLGCLEITGGMLRAAALPSGGRIAAAFLSGFGGLCAAAQVSSILSETKVKTGKYLLLRLTAGALCCILWVVLSFLFSFS